MSGPPAVGKSTHCIRLAKDLDFEHVSLDGLIRREQSDETSPYQTFVSQSMEKSIPLPAQLTSLFLEREIHNAKRKGKTKFIFEGFPQSVAQVKDFEVEVHDQSSGWINAQLTFMIRFAATTPRSALSALKMSRDDNWRIGQDRPKRKTKTLQHSRRTNLSSWITCKNMDMCFM